MIKTSLQCHKLILLGCPMKEGHNFVGKHDCTHMVKRCRIDVGLCKKDPPKTHGTRVICKTGAGLGEQRQDGHRARRALCKFLHPTVHIYHNIMC